MRRTMIGLCAAACAVAAIVPGTAGAASSGGWLSVGRGKAEIRASANSTQVGSQFRSLVTYCYKARYDRVKCWWETVERYGGVWWHCGDVATATNIYGYVSVNLGRHWADECYYDNDPTWI